MVLCDVCGNEYDSFLGTCPYCGRGQAAPAPAVPRTNPHKRVNLERGLPPVREALDRLDRELDAARREGRRALTLIHGYGSSGRGGAMRHEVRGHLAYLLHRGAIRLVVHGEDFSRRNGSTRELLRRVPALSRHPDLGRGNLGITIVLL